MPKGLRTECIVDGRRVRYETSDDFTRIVSADDKGHRNIRLYGYGWEIRKNGYYYHLRWYRGESGGDILRMRSAESAKAYARLHPVPGCRNDVRPSEPIREALGG